MGSICVCAPHLVERNLRLVHLFIGAVPTLQTPPSRDAMSQLRSARRSSSHEPAAPWRILIIEDDRASRAALEEILRNEGFIVHQASDGVEGVALVQRTHPDLVVLDLALPRMNGIEAARILKGDQSTAEIPLLAITASWLGSAADRLRLAGFAAAMRKPFAPDELLGQITRLLDSPKAWLAAPLPPLAG